MSPPRVLTEVDGRELSLSNLEKVLYPKVGFTKGEVLDYYARIAEVMLVHIADRPATLHRYPNGVEGTSFYEKHVPRHAPSWLGTVRVPGRGTRARGGGVSPDFVDYALLDDRAALIWVANLAALEIHVPMWHVGKRRNLPPPPDFLVFDLDPGPGTTIVECCAVALAVKTVLTKEGFGEAFPKTSGSKGLQVYVQAPRRIDSEHARELALELARRVEKDHGELVVTNMRKDLRNHRVLIDWSQNNPAKTTIGAYSLRARDEPSVATPVTWQEVRNCRKKADPLMLHFLAKEVLARVDKFGDLMAPLAQRA